MVEWHRKLHTQNRDQFTSFFWKSSSNSGSLEQVWWCPNFVYFRCILGNKRSRSTAPSVEGDFCFKEIVAYFNKPRNYSLFVKSSRSFQFSLPANCLLLLYHCHFIFCLFVFGFYSLYSIHLYSVYSFNSVYWLFSSNCKNTVKLVCNCLKTKINLWIWKTVQTQ